jgi:hypothetical protein
MEKIDINRIPDDEKPKNFDDFICKICTYIIHDPYECENCGIPYCKDCLTKWEMRSNQCPIKCDTVMKTKPAHKFIKKMLGELKIKCKNQDCGIVIEISRMNYHLKECEYEILKCPNEECAEKISRKDLEKHREACKFKTIQCERCAESFRDKEQNVMSLLESHDCVKSLSDKLRSLNLNYETLMKKNEENEKTIKDLKYSMDLLLFNISYKCENGHNLIFRKTWDSTCASCDLDEICTRWGCTECDVNYCLDCIKILNHVCCPNAHTFIYGASEEILECDLCRMEVQSGPMSLHDRVCNFDLCEGCVKKLFPYKSW